MLNSKDSFQNLLFPVPETGAPEIMVYAEHSTKRLEYVLNFVFRRVLLCGFRLTGSFQEFQSFQGPKLNYSLKHADNSLSMKPEGLLSENGLRKEKPILYFKDNFVRCFVTGSSESTREAEQDVFALVFYFLSRYEEWQETYRDEHGRFPAEKSLLQEAGIGTLPLVDLAVLELKEKFEAFFPGLKFPQREARLLSTIDVDNLYAFQNKPMWRQAGASARDLIQGDFKQLIHRCSVLSGKVRDPFDIYDEVPHFCENNQIPLIFFFLYTSGSLYDRSLKAGASAFRKVFERLKRYPCRMGLHPSYYSTTKEKLLINESRKFKEDSGVDELWSRQHFLRFDIRNVAENLLLAGIQVDFSMGWSDRAGFRAGTAFPFPYYDFEKESERELLFVPFCLMDGAYSIHHQEGHEYILKDALTMAEQIKTCRSIFISVYHERSFYNHLYPGFGPLYKEIHLRIKELFSA